MRIEANSYQNTKPSFQAIRIPLDKGNYDAIISSIYSASPLEKISTPRGESKIGEMFDYIMTKFGSDTENKIIQVLKTKLNLPIKVVKNESTVEDIDRYYATSKQITNEEVIHSAYAEPETERRANDIRRIWILRDNIPDYKERQIWEKEKRLDVFALKRLVKSLMQKPYVDNEKLEKAIDTGYYNIVQLQPDGYKGESLAQKPQALNAFRDAGVRRVIDLAGSYDYYKKRCAECGLGYTERIIPHSYWEDNPAFQTQKESGLNAEMHQKYGRDTIENLIGLVTDINKGGYYMGCDYGKEASWEAIRLNWLLNPKSKIEPEFCYKSNIPREALRGLYSNLTDFDKKRLGIEINGKFDRQRKHMLELE